MYSNLTGLKNIFYLLIYDIRNLFVHEYYIPILINFNSKGDTNWQCQKTGL